MKKVLKILLIVLLVIVANIGILVNTVQAVENGEQITIYSKGYFNRVIRNNGIVIKTSCILSKCCISRKWKRISSLLLKS